MDKQQADDLNTTITLMDALLRLKAMENILISKGLFTQEEYTQEINDLAAKVAKTILQKSNVPGDLDDLIKNLTVKGGNNN
jgi:hypothetical protein